MDPAAHPPMSNSETFLCGVIEGFYGRPWTPAQRDRLLGWMRDWRMNTYLFAPKDDIKHRAIWRETYDEVEVAALRRLIDGCRERGIEFVYALAPGLDIRYADELPALQDKLRQIAALGVKSFALLFDDIPEEMRAEDRARFGTFAGAQAAVTNAVLDWLRGSVPGAALWFCPTIYCGRFADLRVPENAYLRELGEQLAPGVEVLWTGPEVVPEEISVASIREVAAVLRRKPLIWENLHANDYDLRRLYLGPFAGRPAGLRAEVRGVLSNPNIEFEANFVPLHTLATYGRERDWDEAAALRAARADWLPRFRTRAGRPFTAADLELLVDLLYLPFSDGPRAAQFVADTAFLLHHPVAEWGTEREARFRRTGDDINALQVRITELADRELCFTLLRYVGEIDREVRLLRLYFEWLKAGPAPGAKFSRPVFMRPGVYRGGVPARLQALFPMDAHGDFSPGPTSTDC